MCLHPKDIGFAVSNCVDKLGHSTLSSNLFDEIVDLCCYIDSVKELEADDLDLIVMQLNIRSLTGKVNTLQDLLSDTSADVCLLNETWLNEHNKKLCTFNNYTLESVERKHKKDGGVGVVVSNDLDYKRRDDLEVNCPNLENCILEIYPIKNKCIILTSVYHPPNSNINDFFGILKHLLNKIGRENKEIIIGMDHNFDHLKYGLHEPTQCLLETLLEHELFPTITLPTRITKSTATLIDNIFVTKRLFKNYSSGVMVTDISDHLPCLLVSKESKLKRTPLPTVTCRKIMA